MQEKSEIAISWEGNKMYKERLEILGGWMEYDGIRLQMEAEVKRELTEEEWIDEVKSWFDDVVARMQDCSMTMRDAYLDILR